MKTCYTIIIGLLLFQAKVFGGVVYSTNTTNNWNNALTWSTGSLPTTSDTVVILSGHYVNVNGNNFYAQIRALRVEPGATIYFMDGAGVEVFDTIRNKGTLMVTNGSIGSWNHFRSDGYINIGASSTLLTGINNFNGGNALFQSDSLVTTGTIIVNGRFASSGYFVQTAGSITVDGNSSIAATSVAEGDNIIAIDATNAHCSGGSIMIVDPHHSSMFPFVNDVEITGHNLSAFSGTHTFYIGNGVSSVPGPVNRGFNFGNGLGVNYAPIQNLIVQSGSATERQFRTSIKAGGGTYIKGNVSVINNSDFQHIWVHNPDCAIGGDINIEAGSFFTSSRNVTLGGVQGVYDITTDQDILAGSPATNFRNDYINANVTANFNTLTINHANRSEVDLSSYMGGITIADSLILKQGFLHADNMAGGYFVQLGLNATRTGKLVYQDGHVSIGKQGHFTRWIGNGTIAAGDPQGLFPVCYARNGSFPIGNSDGVRHFQISGQATAAAAVGLTLGTFYTPAELPPSQVTTINGTSIDARAFGNGWGIYAPGIAGTFNLKGRCGNVIVEQNVSDLYMKAGAPLSASAANVAGTGVADSFWTGLNNVTGAELANGHFFLTGNKQNLITRIPSKQSGDYNDTATWKYNIIPDWNTGYGTLVMPGHTVTAAGSTSYPLLGLEVRPGGTMNVGLMPPYNMEVSRYGTEIAGALNLEQGSFRSHNMQEKDTAIWIKPTGTLTNSGDLATYSGNAGWRNSGFYSEGELNMSSGTMKIEGAMKLAGNAAAHVNGGKIYLDGNSGVDSSSAADPLFDIATEGTVDMTHAEIFIINPSLRADTATVRIQRNTTNNIDLRKSKLYFGLQPGAGFNTIQYGDMNTGYKVETKAGTQNIPLGRIYVAGGSGAGRFVRNGNNGFFVSDSVSIKQGSTLWIATDADNYIGGNVYNDGVMASEGRITFGGTTQFPATRPILVRKTANGIFRNGLIIGLNSFNKVGINTEGPSVLFDFVSTIAQELKLDKGLLMINADLTLGTGVSNVGSLVVGEGRLVIQPYYGNSYFKRWFNTSTVNLTDAEGWFPFATPAGEDRSLRVSGTPVTGGIISVSGIAPDVGSGNTNGWIDGGIAVHYIRGGMWDVKAESGFDCAAMSVRAIAGGLSVGNFANARLLRLSNPASTPGVHVSATGTNMAPVVTRAGINSASLTGNNYFGIATPSSEMYFAIQAVQSGNWNNPSTWNCNCLPGSGSRVYIGNNYHVVIDDDGPRKITTGVELHNKATLSINSDTLFLTGGFGFYDSCVVNINGGFTSMNFVSTYNGQNYPFGTYLFGGVAAQFNGTLNITGGTLTLGGYAPWHTVYSNGIRMYFDRGNFNMSGGVFSIKGQLVIDSTMDHFHMTGGSIYVDGNSPQTDTSYVLHGYPIFEVRGASPGNSTQLTGGHIYIPNPTRFNDYSFISYSRLINSNTNLAGSTIHFGMPGMNDNDISYNQTAVAGQPGQATGFKVYTGENNGTRYPVPMGNVMIEGRGGAASGRHVYNDFGFHAKGNVTIEPGSEWRLYNGNHDQYVGGDLINNGVLTSQAAPLNFGGENYTVVNAQTVSGTGRFRSAITDIQPTANEPLINKMTFNNFSTAGVTIDVPNLRTVNLNMQNGDIHVANGNNFIFGASYANLTPFLQANGTGVITGKLKQYIYGNIAQNYVFPLGVAGNRRKVTINYTTPPATDGYLTGEFVAVPPGNAGLPLTEGSINVNQASTSGVWRLEPETITGGQYNITADAKNFGGVNDYTKLVLLKRDNSSAPWTLQGNHVATTGNNANPVLQRTGLSSFSEFGVGGDAAINPLPLKLIEFTAVKEGTSAKLQWTTTNEVNMDKYIVERSADGRNFEIVGKVAAAGKGAGAQNNYTFDDAAPLAGWNYYRLNMISKDGVKEYSPQRALNFNNIAASVDVYPNPATGVLHIRSGSTINRVSLSDNLGRIVYTAEPLSLTFTIEVGHFTKGIYNLQLTTESGSETKKVQIQ